jgi:hypothetical protein
MKADAKADAAFRVLKPASSPGVRLGASLLFALVWNGVVSMFVREAVVAWRGGDSIVGALFLSPFVVIGLGALGYSGKALLAMWNPRPRLILRPGAVALGARGRIEWTIEGAAERIAELTLTLEGREEATYQRGTDTKTDRSVFHRQRLARADEQGPIRRGEATFVVPQGSMPTFDTPEASHNKIIWSVRVHGALPRWPDVEEQFPITVLPRAPEASS